MGWSLSNVLHSINATLKNFHESSDVKDAGGAHQVPSQVISGLQHLIGFQNGAFSRGARFLAPDAQARGASGNRLKQVPLKTLVLNKVKAVVI